MTRSFRYSLFLTSLVAAQILCAPAPAQDPPAEPSAASAPAAADVPTEADADAPEEPAVERNPAVRAALELPREQPADYFQALSWLIDLGRPELAAPILEELRGLPLTDEQRAELVSRFGSHRMLQLARTVELAPAGGEFAEACMTAAAAAARDPQHLAQLVSQLTSPSAEARQAARVDLVAAGQAGVNATLEALAREPNPQRRAALMSATARMDPLVVDPLLGMLATQDPSLKADVSRLLTHLQVTQAAPFVSSTAGREQRLAAALARYREGTPPFAPDEENRVELWHWNDAAKTLTATRHPADEARTIWMSRLARELARLRPDNRAYRRQAIVLLLEADGLLSTNGEQRTSINLNAADTSLINESLADALAGDYPNAAAMLATDLGSRRNTIILSTTDGQPSPLAAALTHPNRRVRFAALRAIMLLDPELPYPGSSRLPEALAYFATSSGTRRALVAMPTAARATDVAGALAAHGLESDATNKGTEAVELARHNGDLEMIFIDMDIQAPGVRDVLYELRIHPATAAVPIALLAAEGRLADAQRLAEEHDAVIATSRPHSPEAVSRTVDALVTVAGRNFVPAGERAAQAIQSVTWLAKLLASDRDFYALRRHTPTIEAALYRTGSDQAITALESLGTHESQMALLDYASQNTLPAENRRAAATAFGNSIVEHGVLLTSDEIFTQYDRYNASAAADSDTQQILGALLDAIESHREEVGTLP